MKYSHELYDHVMAILNYAHDQLLAKGDGATAALFREAIDWNEEMFIFNADKFLGLVPLALNNWKVVGDTNFRDLNEDEQEASLAAREGRGPRATSTKTATQAVSDAAKRLKKAARMRPVTDAQEAVTRAEGLRDEKKRIADEAEAERTRPAREKADADKALKDAKGDLKKVEREIGEKSEEK